MRQTVAALIMTAACCLTIEAATQMETGTCGEDTSLNAHIDKELLQRAESGDTEAMNYLGYLLLSGEEGTGRDAASGLSWLVRAASKGDVKAMSNLGWLFLEGDLVEKDERQAAEWLAKAASKGLPVAQSMLGDLYRDGTGVKADTLAADSLYREAFEHGLADAGHKLYALNEATYQSLPHEQQVETGRYFYLRGAPQAGVALFEAAATQGDPDAKALLGDAYSRGIGVAYNHALSTKYFVEAAMAGQPSAQFIVGEMLDVFPDALSGLELSEDVPADPTYWYEQAALSGITDGAAAYEYLLTPWE